MAGDPCLDVRSRCIDVRSLTDPFVSLEALGALSALLDQVLKTDAPSSNARLRDASGISRHQNRGETHGREDGVGDRDSAQTAPRVTADGYVRKPGRARRAGLARPAKDAQEALLGPMTCLILEYARATAAPTRAGGDHDR